MPGLVYIDTNSNSIMLTDAKYFDCPAQYKKLKIRTGTNVSDTIGYPLTTDTSASNYSPIAIMYTNSSVCYIGTYSIGSSSASGTYSYIVQSGYERVVTRVEAVTERRTGSGQYTYQESYTQQYSHHTEGTASESYYSRSGSLYAETDRHSHSGNERKVVGYGYGTVVASIQQWPYSDYDNVLMGQWRYSYGKYTKSGSTVNDGSWGAIKNAGASRTARVTQNYHGGGDQNYENYTYEEYITLYSRTRAGATYAVDGYVSVPGRTSTVYSTTTIYEVKTSYTEGVYTATLYYNSYYSSRYTQRTSSSSRSGGEAWTHSNINVL